MEFFRLVLSALLAFTASTASAQSVFAHVLVGNNGAYKVSNWASDIALAASYGIDGFALDIAEPLVGTIANQTKLAFQAAEAAGSAFKLFLCFDYLGGNGPWATADILSLLQQYSNSSAYFNYRGKPFVSTFEGPTNSDVNQWSTIRGSIPGGIYFVPDWTSQGPGWNMNLYDGAFSWSMWPNGPNNMTTAPDQAWQNSLTPAGKSYMMGVSPWFYTDLPLYHKAWVWRGDRLWYDRWQETLQVLPEFVQIVSWNDFGECHYIGPIWNKGVPTAPNANATSYVLGYQHQAWLQTLPFQIAAYKNAVNSSNPAPVVPSGGDKVVYWYRTAPAAAGSTDCTGNCAPSNINTGGYQNYYLPAQILEDEIFAIALLSKPGTVSIKIGSNPANVFKNLKAGINFISQPFNNQTGKVLVRSSIGNVGKGVAITSDPASGIANFNAWVGTC